MFVRGLSDSPDVCGSSGYLALFGDTGPPGIDGLFPDHSISKVSASEASLNCQKVM